MVVNGQSGCIRAKVVVFGQISLIEQKRFDSGKS